MRDRTAREDLPQDAAELLRTGQVVTEGFLDDDPPPATAILGGQAGPFQLLYDQRKQTRGDGQVEGGVTAGSLLVAQIGHGGRECVEGGIVGEVAGDEPETLGQLVPDIFPEFRARMLSHGVVDLLGEVLVGELPARKPDKREGGREQSAIGQVVDRRHQLLAGQVPCDTEDHQRAGPGHTRQPPIGGTAQRVRVRVLRLSHVVPLSAANASATVARRSSQAFLNLSTPSTSRVSKTSGRSMPRAVRVSNTC